MADEFADLEAVLAEATPQRKWSLGVAGIKAWSRGVTLPSMNLRWDRFGPMKERA